MSPRGIVYNFLHGQPYAVPIEDVLVAHLIVENALENALRRAVPNPDALDIRNLRYRHKVTLFSAHYAPDSDTVELLNRLNRARNAAAHNLQVTNEEICEILGALTPGATAIQCFFAIRDLVDQVMTPQGGGLVRFLEVD